MTTTNEISGERAKAIVDDQASTPQQKAAAHGLADFAEAIARTLRDVTAGSFTSHWTPAGAEAYLDQAIAWAQGQGAPLGSLHNPLPASSPRRGRRYCRKA